MDKGHFYYIDDQYFSDFPDPMLMQNKETINGQAHDRPCFYAFQDTATKSFQFVLMAPLNENYSVKPNVLWHYKEKD